MEYTATQILLAHRISDATARLSQLTVAVFSPETNPEFVADELKVCQNIINQATETVKRQPGQAYSSGWGQLPQQQQPR